MTERISLSAVNVYAPKATSSSISKLLLDEAVVRETTQLNTCSK